MDMAQGTPKKPFKGLHYYEEEDRDIFFGRSREARELFNLVELNPLTLVFGKSGIGKTSLVNAGLVPLLRQKSFLPVRIRLDYAAGGLPLVGQIKKEMAVQCAAHGITVTPKPGILTPHIHGEEVSLWQFFRAVDFLCPGAGDRPIPVTPVLILDQFEEFFTLGKHHAQREALRDQLYWLIEDQVPPLLEAQIINRQEVFPYLSEYSTFRVVLGLREDYLPHMDDLKKSIPSLHRVMYRVKHLNGLQAREVMDKTGVFKDETIKQDILEQFYPGDMERETVSLDQLEVEPALFSLLCDQVYEKGVGSLTKQAKDEILAAFYQGIIEQLPQPRVLAEWIEDHLLTDNGFRTPCYLERQFAHRQGIETATDKKLLRKLFIGDKEHVEIIHDVLAPVIHQRKKKRLEEVKRQEMEKEWRRRRKINAIVSMVAIIAIGLAIFAFVQKRRADEQYKEAIQQKNRADEQSLVAINQKTIATQNEQKALEQKKEQIIKPLKPLNKRILQHKTN